MGKRKKAIREEFIEDADGALRALSRRFPEGLAQIVLRPGEQIESAEWLETQVAVRQLRMDRVLHVCLVGGKHRLVHGEWTDRLDQRVQRRLGEYPLSVAIAERIDTEASAKSQPGRRNRRRLESIVVVLRGRQKRWPNRGSYRTTPADTKFGGAWYHIEPVYQRTVAELEAKCSPFWLAFVPLAIDTDDDKLQRIIEKLRQEVEKEDFDELIATMISMARLKKDTRRFIDVIKSSTSEEKPMHPFMRLGIEEGIERGRALYLHLFERRLQRPMTESERNRLAKRMVKDDPKTLGNVLIDLSPEQLAAWLAPRKSSKRKG